MRSEGDKDNEAYHAALGARVREARAKRGMARRILSHASGVSERYLAQLENGTGNPSIAVLRQIAEAVDYPLSELVTGTASGPPEFFEILKLLQSAPHTKLADILANVKQVLSADRDTNKGERIALIGLRGAGKSTLGRLLAEKLSVQFIELDRIIEQEYGASIGEILALGGQAAFRRHEYRALESVIANHQRAVIATGGGIVSQATTFSLLLENTHTIWLSASPEEHMSRVIEQGDLRPMAKVDEAMDDLRAILRARELQYRMAHATLDTAGRTVTESLEDLHAVVLRLLAAHTSGHNGQGTTNELRQSGHAL